MARVAAITGIHRTERRLFCSETLRLVEQTGKYFHVEEGKVCWRSK